MSNKSVRYVVRFSGHVQGVGFRATTLAVANGLDVHGFVRNESDGSVKLDVDGSDHELRELIRRVQTAMSGRIDRTDIDKQATKGRCDGFHIQH